MNIKTVNARRFLDFDIDTLWDNFRGDVNVVFDDGEMLCRDKDILFSVFAWRYHKEFPLTPLKKSHCLVGYVKNGTITANTHLKIIGAVLFDVLDAYMLQAQQNGVTNLGDYKVELLDRLAKIAYEIANELYNKGTIALEAYVTSIDILDFAEIALRPELLKAMDEMPNSEKGIESVYSMITNIIDVTPELSFNPLVKAFRANIVDRKQIMQCVGPRGFLTDMDSTVFKNAIRRGFFHGIRTLEDAMKESRSAAKALAFSTDTLQQSEYFSRRQQLICQSLQRLHRTDCQSKSYLLWHVRGPRGNGNGSVGSGGDLVTLAGKYYLDETTNTLKVIKPTDKHLIDKTLKLRSFVAGCQHDDPAGVCEVCFGQAADAIPENTNLGSATCVEATEKISQNVLSTKHLDGTSVVEGIVLDNAAKQYLKAMTNGSDYYLNEAIKNQDPQLIFDPKYAPGLTDLSEVEDVNKLNLSRVSEFEVIQIQTTNKDSVECVTLDVSVKRRLGFFTHFMLEHIRLNGWTVNQDNNYVVSMKGWDYTKPMISLPMRQFNMGDFRAEIAEALEATVKDMSYRDCVVTPSAMLVEFHDLVNDRLSINLSILEAIVYSSMVVSATNGDYSLPKAHTTSGLGVMRLLLQNRSVSATMAYERHKSFFLDPASYLKDNRFEGIFDQLLCAAEMQEKGYLTPS